jgi:hypothetical protein
VVSAEAGGVCDITTHPPTPSQREGGEPPLECFAFKKIIGPVDLAFEAPKNREKCIPLPFGKRPGDGFQAQHQILALAP